MPPISRRIRQDWQLLGKDTEVNRIVERLRALMAFLAAGPGGHTMVTHHHLHKD